MTIINYYQLIKFKKNLEENLLFHNHQIVKLII